jgi:transcriptional regulator of acetoin/glycerol metabolism
MCYMIAETGDCPFCKAIMHHTQTRHAPTLPRDEITRADPLTGDESDDALLRMPFKEARAAAIDAFEERYVLRLLERTQHNVSKAARLAGIDCNYLYRMRKKHGIARKE